MDKKRSLIDEYFDLQIEYEKKYGPKTLVLMQVGSFFEYYGVNNAVEKIGNVKVIADLMNIQMSRRDKSILENNRKNALMAGFPTANLKKYLNLMIANNYTIVLVEQTTSPPDPKREITHIYSPSTYIDESMSPDSNMFVSIYMNEIGGNKSSYSCGLSAIDITTGTSYVYHITNMTYDKKAIVEDIYRFVENFNPKEVLFMSYDVKSITKGMIEETLSNGSRILHIHYNEMDSNHHYLKTSYLNSVLEKVYKNHGILSGIEYIHLEKYIDTVISYVIGIQWAYDHDPHIIEKIKIPQLYEYHKHLILYHNASYQLNLIHHKGNNNDVMGKYKSLFDIINKTSTPMGRRKLKYDLLNPITNREELELCYERIEKMVSYEKVEEQLNGIMDMERCHRKMGLKILHPHEFSSLYFTYENVKSILENMGNEMDMEKYYKINEREMDEFYFLMEEINKYVDVNEMGKYNLNDIQNSFFKNNVFEDIDKIQNNIKEIEEYMDKEILFLNNELKKKDKSTFANDSMVKIEEKDGYCMVLTKRRFELLSKETQNKYIVSKGVGTNIRISNSEFDDKSILLVDLRKKIQNVVKDKYVEFKESLILKYGKIMDKIVDVISYIDVVKSHKKCACLYGYNKPCIENNEKNQSYVKAKGIRHPIIEIIEDTKAYITNDVEIGNNCRGFLLYGVNGVGKSSLSKAIGINIIMAQMGMYVPSKEFVYYPFTKIFTRINGDDNIFKGMSSFVVEMNELRSILKYADERSIVLGDEVCKGTEETSALSIVASTIQHFSKKNVNFILATHFHKLYDILSKRELPNISFKHLSVQIDTKNDMILYGRKLIDGMGSTNYGLDIARFILEDDIFMVNAKEVRDEILELDKNIISTTTSNYNKNIYVHECAICGKTGQSTQLDTHHIIEQHEFNEYKVKDGIRKDSAHNLVVLCKIHHDEVHNGNLNIYGYKDGPSGRFLDYEFKSEEIKEEIKEIEYDDKMEELMKEEGEMETKNVKINKNKKYGEEIVNKVMEMGKEYEEQLNKIKIIQTKINKMYNVMIPTGTLKKMIEGNY